jgi:hypothetical protein
VPASRYRQAAAVSKGESVRSLLAPGSSERPLEARSPIVASASLVCVCGCVFGLDVGHFCIATALVECRVRDKKKVVRMMDLFECVWCCDPVLSM